MKRFFIMLLAATLALSSVMAAGTPEAEGGKSQYSIGLLMPTKEQTIWIVQTECFIDAFEKAGFKVFYEYAQGDSGKQVMQIENMIAKGVDALVITPIDCAALSSVCEKAKEAGIVIVSSDRLITNTDAVDFYTTHDLVRLGEIQGQYIADGLGLEKNEGPFTLEIFSGPLSDTNAIKFYDGAMKILRPYLDSGKLVVKSGQIKYPVTAIESWDTAIAQARMDNLLSGFYTDSHLDAVLAASDCLSIGVSSSLESMGYGKGGQPFPIVVGQDCELASIKNIKRGTQSMSMFLDANELAAILVPLVTDLLEGKEVPADATFNNGVKDVPAKTYIPLPIDINNLDYLIEVGFYTDEQING